jgi:hypothetical protein
MGIARRLLGRLEGSTRMAFSSSDDTQAAPIEPDDAPEGLALATFAAGCFWGVEDFFLHVPGVVDAVSGYTGGSVSAPTYGRCVRAGRATQRRF